MYLTARLFGAFDAKRVEDRTAGQGIIVLQMNTFNSMPQEKLIQIDNYRKENYAQNSDEFKTYCNAIKNIGYPEYYPKYMILHGIQAFSGIEGDGLKSNFDKKSAWAELVNKNCTS